MDADSLVLSFFTSISFVSLVVSAVSLVLFVTSVSLVLAQLGKMATVSHSFVAELKTKSFGQSCNNINHDEKQ